MNKHTPGPWKWDESWGAIVVDRPSMQKLICPMWTGCDRRGMPAEVAAEDEANARLIAAAPDLLAACKRAVHLYDHDDATSVLEWVNSPEFRAAIAKAEGGAE